MLVLRDPISVQSVQEPYMRRLLALRFEQLAQGEPYEADVHGFFVVVEPGDTVAAIEAACEWPILRSIFDDSRYGAPDFAPAFEVLEEHATCFEVVFVLNDGGYGFVLWVPKLPEVSEELLAFCHEYAVTDSGGIAEWVQELDTGAREFFEERAGVREHDGGLGRDDAEKAAWIETVAYLQRRASTQ